MFVYATCKFSKIKLSALWKKGRKFLSFNLQNIPTFKYKSTDIHKNIYKVIHHLLLKNTVYKGICRPPLLNCKQQTMDKVFFFPVTLSFQSQQIWSKTWKMSPAQFPASKVRNVWSWRWPDPLYLQLVSTITCQSLPIIAGWTRVVKSP